MKVGVDSELGVDLDGILGGTQIGFIRFHNEQYGTKLTLSDVKTHSFSTCIGTSHEEAIRRFHEFYETDYFKNLTPVQDAQLSIEKLNKYFRMHVITNRPNSLREVTHEWLAKYFPHMFHSVHLTNKESNEGTVPKDKFTICKEWGAKVLLEDSVENAVECVTKAGEVGYPLRVVLLDYPWNQSKQLPDGVKRVHSWTEMVKEIVPR